jgi:hypothetical protein
MPLFGDSCCGETAFSARRESYPGTAYVKRVTEAIQASEDRKTLRTLRRYITEAMQMADKKRFKGASWAVDNFNRADANPISGEWVTVTGCTTAQIVSNQAKGTA